MLFYFEKAFAYQLGSLGFRVNMTSLVVIWTLLMSGLAKLAVVMSNKKVGDWSICSNSYCLNENYTTLEMPPNLPLKVGLEFKINQIIHARDNDFTGLFL